MNEETIDLAGKRQPIRYLAGEDLALLLRVRTDGALQPIADYDIEATITDTAGAVLKTYTRANGGITDQDANHALWQATSADLATLTASTYKYKVRMGEGALTSIIRGPFTIVKD